MQVQLPIEKENGEPIYKNITNVIVIYVSKNKEVFFYRIPFIETPYGMHATINHRGYVFSKKNICWRKVKKLIRIKKYAEWEPYVIVLDSQAYEAMLP